mmetsp:Transcript_9889/g.19419  ORF Transcript_9889/g.19419 Transcript_9889/m.19419 type:complete len:219 (-) Transcript_9889:940-1596(-)
MSVSLSTSFARIRYTALGSKRTQSLRITKLPRLSKSARSSRKTFTTCPTTWSMRLVFRAIRANTSRSCTTRSSDGSDRAVSIAGVRRSRCSIISAGYLSSSMRIQVNAAIRVGKGITTTDEIGPSPLPLFPDPRPRITSLPAPSAPLPLSFPALTPRRAAADPIESFSVTTEISGRRLNSFVPDRTRSRMDVCALSATVLMSASESLKQFNKTPAMLA